MNKLFIFILIIMLFPHNVFSTHIVGGELNYTYLGNSDYEIKLTVYRDCINGQAPFDSPASIGIFDVNNNLVREVLVNITDQNHISNAVNSPCFTPPTDVCYEYAHYIEVVNLPPIPGGYQIVYQRCCRNGTIINLQDVAATGATYVATIPDVNLVTVNSNPVFNNLPPTFICEGAPFTFDHSATDADGDSLVYELCTPYHGADQTMPMPQPPNPPPFQLVVFQPPYNLSNVMGGVPMTIDPYTGIIHAVPGGLGQFVYGVRVKEYRNGVLIGDTRRDFQANVTHCENYTVASVFDRILACGTRTAHFNNYSYGSGLYAWDFGDPTTANDTSTLVTPDYTYPDTGIYTVQLVAYSSILPTCNDTAYARAYVYPKFYSGFTIQNQHCDDLFSFTDTSIGIDGAANYWLWDFGDGTFSSSQNNSHNYPQQGSYNVTLISATDSGCTDTTTQIIHALSVPSSNFTASLDTCHSSVTFSNHSLNASFYNWNFGDTSTSNLQNPEHRYSLDGNYSVQLIAYNDSGCADTSLLTLALPNVPIANFDFSILNCDSVVHLVNTSSNGFSFQWDFDDHTYGYVANMDHRYFLSGTYNITLAVYAPNNPCHDAITHEVVVNKKPTADFASTLDTCLLNVSVINNSINATNYLWAFSDGGVSAEENPGYHFTASGNADINLIARNDSGCADTVNKVVNIPPLPVADFSILRGTCDSLVQFNDKSSDGVAYQWSFGDSDTAGVQNPLHTYNTTGVVPVTMISTSAYGCKDTVEKNISIVTQVPADFSVFVDSCTSLVYFQSNSPLAVNYSWTFGDGDTSSQQSPIHMYNETAPFPAMLTVNKGTGCDESIIQKINFETPLGEILRVPNAFTPNGDGKNEKFEVVSFRPCDVYSLVIFNRWGQKIFETDDALNNAWDGTYNGHGAEQGVYVYILKGTSLRKTGYVALIK